MWHVYILKTKYGTLYTGITNDLARRMEAHKSGRGAKFTRGFGYSKLLYEEKCLTRSAAAKREAQIKHLCREQKLGLIRKKV